MTEVLLYTGRYKANFTKGGLMVPESRLVADLLLQGVDADSWKHAIEVENVLRKRSPATAVGKAGLIRARLRTMTPELWTLVRDAGKPVATQAVFAATLKYSPLLADFLDLVVLDLYRRFEPQLKPRHWERYLEDCHLRDLRMPVWSAATLTSLRRRAFGMLAEAGYLSDSRPRSLQALRLEPEVVACLRAQGEDDILRCMQIRLT